MVLLKKILKRLAAGFLGKLLYSLHKFPPPISKLPSREEALSVLQNLGYEFPPLWMSMPPLLESSCDLSIVIPVYNSELFLERCLLSILNQRTHYNYEVICIDDGSTDNSSIILDQAKRQHSILTVHHQENQGISKARNQGIVMARGRYIGFIDNDDFVDSDYVEKILDRAMRTNADIVQTAFNLVDSEGVEFKKKPKPSVVITDSESYRMYQIVNGYIWGGAIKKELFTNVRFPENFWYEDMIMRMVLMRLAKVYSTVPEMLYHKTSHANNATIRLWKTGAIKSVDQYWLPTQFIRYQREKLNLPLNDGQYFSLLEQHTVSLWSRTNRLPNSVRKSLFVLASEDIISLAYIPKAFDSESRDSESVLKKKNWLAWLCLSASRYYTGFSK